MAKCAAGTADERRVGGGAVGDGGALIDDGGRWRAVTGLAGLAGLVP